MENINLVLKRIYKGSDYTIGKLYINNKYFCDTIEDKDRDLNENMSVDEIKSKKVYGETAIPYGKYEIVMNIKSNKYSNFEKYPWAKKYDGYLPRLLNVKGYEGVLMHVGNNASHTEGCLLLGKCNNLKEGKIVNSTNIFIKLMDEVLIPAKKENSKISIKIEQEY